MKLAAGCSTGGRSGGTPMAVVSSARVKGAAARDRVCVGAIAGAHGIRGLDRIKPFTDLAEDVAAYGPVSDEPGNRRFEIRVEDIRGGMVIAALKGVATGAQPKLSKASDYTSRKTNCRRRVRMSSIMRISSGWRLCRMGIKSGASGL